MSRPNMLKRVGMEVDYQAIDSGHGFSASRNSRAARSRADGACSVQVSAALTSLLPATHHVAARQQQERLSPAGPTIPERRVARGLV